MNPNARLTFGLVAFSEAKRIILPLRAVKADFAIAGGLAEVTVTQVFYQENDRPLDCEYLFPLPGDAAVYSCEAFINDRVIRAKVEERAKAVQMAREHKRAGHRTALVEAERDNLFTLCLGNLQPQDLVEVRLAYVQSLRGQAGQRSVEIPFCPGQRYIPGRPLLRSNCGRGIADDTDQVPDASRITPVRIGADHPDAAFVEVDGRIEAQFVEAWSLVSPSHTLALSEKDGVIQVRLGSAGEVPDCDFVLRWKESAAARLTPRAWTCDRGGETFALFEVRAPEVVTETELLPQDVYFLVDRSGSMDGEKWDKAVQALQACVRVLGAQDRAMITFFESTVRDFAEAPRLRAQLLEDAHFMGIQSLGTGGGTELAPALKRTLEQVARHSSGRRANLVLITDAQVGNDQEILTLMRQAPRLPVHCFGIDIALNDALLLALAQQQGGTFHSLNPQDDIPAAVRALGRTLSQPVLLDLELAEGWEPAEARLPDLYAGQVLYASARRKGQAPLVLTARDAAGEPTRTEFAIAPAPGAGPYLHWCRGRLQHLLRGAPESPDAVALSIASNLLCRLTAFIAWDEAEKVVVANLDLVQPSQELGELRKLERSDFIGFCQPPYYFDRQAESAEDRCLSAMAMPGPRASRDPLADAVADSSPEARLDAEWSAELQEVFHGVGGPDGADQCAVLLKWVFESDSPAQRRARFAQVKNLIRTLKRIRDEYAALETPSGRIHEVLSPARALERPADVQARRQALEQQFTQVLREFMRKQGITV